MTSKFRTMRGDDLIECEKDYATYATIAAYDAETARANRAEAGCVALDKAIVKFLEDINYLPPWEVSGTLWAIKCQELNRSRLANNATSSSFIGEIEQLRTLCNPTWQHTPVVYDDGKLLTIEWPPNAEGAMVSRELIDQWIKDKNTLRELAETNADARIK